MVIDSQVMVRCTNDRCWQQLHGPMAKHMKSWRGRRQASTAESRPCPNCGSMVQLCEAKSLVRTVGNLDDWAVIIPIGGRFRTHDGYFFTRLLCGHFRNEQTTDDPKKKERSPQWCYMGCHSNQ